MQTRSLDQLRTELKNISSDDGIVSLIITRITEVQAKGFGDVTLCIRNGHIYLVKTSSDDYIQKEDPFT